MTDDITTPRPDTEGRNVSVAARPGGGYNVKVCAGTACLFAGSMAVYDAFVQEVQTAGLGDKVEVSIIGCHGLCSMSPVVVLSDDTLYGHLKPKDVAKVVEEHLKGGQPVERFLYKDEQTGERIRDWKDIGFYKLQTRIALRDVGVINPETIDAYIAVGGYEAARMALTEKTPEWIIEEVTDSGIRGRGGAGFPTGVKWKFANQSKSDEKYLICNADEGDPGAFMDCSILEGDPHAVIEGMIIGSYAIGAHEGYVYVRAEYPTAVKRLTMAVAAAEERGFLGKRHLRHRLGVQRAPQARRRRVRLRRGDGAHRLHRGQARHAAHAAAVPRGQRPVGQAHEHQQRRDLLEHPVDHQERRRGLLRARRRDQPRHQGLQPRRQGRQRWPGRGAHGLPASAT